MAGSSSAGAGGGATEVPGVRIVGRTLASGTVTRFGWPGVALRARFSGTQAAIELSDGNNQNAFEVVVDGGAPKKFRTKAGQTSYPLATGLANANHEVLVWRSTEVFDSGTSDFVAINGFSNGGALLSPPPAAERRLEVIGDSISVGAGLEGGAANCAANKLSTDNYYAYGSIAARAVNADLVTVAYSGIGVYRSYSANDPTMPQRYDRTLPGDPAAWDFAKYQPQLVVINLGTNDFGAGDPGQPYVDAYVDFAKHVRSKYTDAYFILIAMYGNQKAAVNSVVSSLKNAGDSRVELLELNSVQNNKGCAQHPDAAAQKAMGDLLTTRIKAALNW
jgi:lysophospholipase L1-like esterase